MIGEQYSKLHSSLITIISYQFVQFQLVFKNKLFAESKYSFYNNLNILKSMQASDVEVIEIDGKKYRITNTVIGQGGVGIVYHVSDDYGKQYALKMIKGYTKSSQLKQMVDSQIKIQRLFIQSKYVITYYGETVVGKNKYILFELGQFSLRKKIQMNHLVQDEYIQMLIDVSMGLMTIHQKKIIHRDIKPENVIFSKGIFKITDFGTSIQKETSSQMVGTVIYWAPEILFDQEEQYTQSVDIWSLGVLAFETYFLIHPFFYNKKITQPRLAIQQLKRNIEALTPNFTFAKLTTRLKMLGLDEKAQFIERKLQQTNSALIDIFKGFFIRNPAKRIEISMLIARLQSIREYQLINDQVKTVLVLQKDIPSDVDFFIEGLKLFYKLDHDFAYQSNSKVEYAFQLALKLLSTTNYKNKNFIEYKNKEKINKMTTEKIVQYCEQIRTTLSQYYFYLQKSKQSLHFFQDLAFLKTYACICSFWSAISKKQVKFCKKIQIITNLSVKNVQQFRHIIPALTQRQLSSIQNLIICDFMQQ